MTLFGRNRERWFKSTLVHTGDAMNFQLAMVLIFFLIFFSMLVGYIFGRIQMRRQMQRKLDHQREKIKEILAALDVDYDEANESFGLEQ